MASQVIHLSLMSRQISSCLLLTVSAMVQRECSSCSTSCSRIAVAVPLYVQRRATV